MLNKRILFLILCFFSTVFSMGLFSQSIKVSEFGFDNPNKAFVDSFNSSYDTLIIDLQRKPWFLRPVQIVNKKNKVVIIEKGVELRAMNNAFPGVNDALLSFIDCQNISIIGNGTEICMNKEEYVEGEWRHGLRLRGCINFKIKNLTIRDSGGDGIFIDAGRKIDYCERIIIDNVHSINNKRQGISIISAKNVLIKNSVFKGTIGTLPGAGIDIEPDEPEDVIENIKVINCRFQNNYGPGIKVALEKLTKDSQDVKIDFIDCFLNNNFSIENPKVSAEIVCESNSNSPVKGAVSFVNCNVISSNWGLLYSRKRADSYSVLFKNCTAMEMGKNGTFPMIYLEVPDYYKNVGPLGGFNFDNLNISSYPSPSLITIRGSRLATLKNLKDFTADIIYKGQFNKTIEYIKYDSSFNENVNLIFKKSI